MLVPMGISIISGPNLVHKQGTVPFFFFLSCISDFKEKGKPAIYLAKFAIWTIL